MRETYFLNGPRTGFSSKCNFSCSELWISCSKYNFSCSELWTSCSKYNFFCSIWTKERFRVLVGATHGLDARRKAIVLDLELSFYVQRYFRLTLTVSLVLDIV